MKPNVIIRADGDPKIGLGHIMRCLALAEMLSGDFNVIFATSSADAVIIEKIENICEVRRVSDFDSFLEGLKKGDIVVLDGYDFDTAHQLRIKESGCKLVCIDDLASTEFKADLIINHSPSAAEMKYKTENYTKILCGPKYVLLRRGFLEAARTDIKKIEEVSSVFICFGGADPANLTCKFLKELLKYPVIKEINIITGTVYNHSVELESIVSDKVKIKKYTNVDENELIHIASSSQLTFVTASTICFEMLALQRSICCAYIAENQKYFYNWLVENKLVHPFGYLSIESDISSKVRDIMNDIQSLIRINTHSRIIDGLSGERLANEFKKLI